MIDDAEPEQLDEAIGIIRKRVDAVGVTEPEVSRQGNTITVQLPGATNQQEVIDLVGTTAELRFRPVLSSALPPDPTEERTNRAAAPGRGRDVRTAARDSRADVTATGHRRPRKLPQPQAQVEADPEDATPPEGPQNSYGVDIQSTEFQQLGGRRNPARTPRTTPREDIKADEPVTLPTARERSTASARRSPRATSRSRARPSRMPPRAQPAGRVGGQSGVPRWRGRHRPVQRGGHSLLTTAMPRAQAQQGSRGHLAIVLDGEVLTAPSINEADLHA